jgi:hypothetical protein
MSGTAKVAGENTTGSNTHTFDIPGVACRYDAYVAKVEWVWIYTSRALWYDFLDGRKTCAR